MDLIAAVRLNQVKIESQKKEIEALSRHKILNRGKIARAKIRLQAIEEGQRDILTPSVTTAGRKAKVVNKNNFATYEAQVDGAYQMYRNVADYGGEIFHAITNIRAAIIGGAGISIISKKESTKKWIEKFLKNNKLHGSRLISMIRTGSLEGKDLIITTATKDGVKARSFPYYENRYTLKVNSKDHDEIIKITYKEKNDQAEPKELPVKTKTSAVTYVKLGGTEADINETTNGLHCSLTACENFSRAYYDLRSNSHNFARLTPVWEFDKDDPTATQDAKGIQSAVTNGEWELGMGYAGKAKHRIAGPEITAHDTLIKDMLSSLKIISTNTGIPVHWLSYPELMSNRATADNILEAVNYATINDRMIWEEGLREMIKKAIIIAIDSGLESAGIQGEFEVKLPLISLANLKQLIEVFWPLVLEKVMSLATFRNMLPGINPQVEEKLIEAERKEAAERSVLQNDTVNDTIQKQQNSGQEPQQGE